MMKRLLILSLSFAVTISSLERAMADGPGTTTAELLKIPIGARAVGMGEAYTAAADDSSSLEWNPAGLAMAQQQEVSFMHSSLIESVHYEHLSFVSPGDQYSWGVSSSYLGYGSIAGYNDLGQSIGDQTAYSAIFNAGGALQIMPRWDVGVTLAGIREKLSSDSAGTFAGNAGTIYTLESKPLDAEYRLGASVLNVGPGLKFVSERDPLPRKIKMGAEMLHVKNWPLNLTADVTVPNDNSSYLSLGSEYWFHDLVALRLGYAGSNDEGKGVRVGMGLKLREILFDYAYGGFGDFGATHRIELAMHFGEPTHQLNGEQRTILRNAKREQNDGNYVQAILDMDSLLDQDPDNSAVLKKMIETHEAMLRKDLNDTVAQTGNDTEQNPSADEFALQDLVPGQQAVAQNMNPAAMGAKVDAISTIGNDPMGLENLPDATHLDTPMTTPANGASAPDPTIGEELPTPNQVKQGLATPTTTQPVYRAVDAAPGVEHQRHGDAIVPNSTDLVPQHDVTPAVNANTDTSVLPDLTPTSPSKKHLSAGDTLPDDTPIAPQAAHAVAVPTSQAPVASDMNGAAASDVPTENPSGAAPAKPATSKNSTSSDNTLVNPSDIYGN